MNYCNNKSGVKNKISDAKIRLFLLTETQRGVIWEVGRKKILTPTPLEILKDTLSPDHHTQARLPLPEHCDHCIHGKF